jgi:hypothetical protein
MVFELQVVQIRIDEGQFPIRNTILKVDTITPTIIEVNFSQKIQVDKGELMVLFVVERAVVISNFKGNS